MPKVLWRPKERPGSLGLRAPSPGIPQPPEVWPREQPSPLFSSVPLKAGGRKHINGEGVERPLLGPWTVVAVISPVPWEQTLRRTCRNI